MAQTPTIAGAGGLTVIANLDERGRAAIAEISRQFPQSVHIAIMRSVNRAADHAATRAVRWVAGPNGVLNIAYQRAADRYVASVQHATPDKPFEATVKLGSRKSTSEGRKRAMGRIPLIEFGARRYGRKNRPGGGVEYSIERGKQKRIPHAFIADMRSGHRGVFIRARFIRGMQMAEESELTRGAIGKGGMLVRSRVQGGLQYHLRREGEEYLGGGQWYSKRKRRERKRLDREPIYELYGPSVGQVLTRDKRVQHKITVDVSDVLNKRLVSQLELLTSRAAVGAGASGPNPIDVIRQRMGK